MIELHNQPLAVPHSIEVRDLRKGPSFPFRGPLPITGMQQGNIPRAMALTRNRRRDTRVHPSAKKHHRL
jgi:hypothetical protein